MNFVIVIVIGGALFSFLERDSEIAARVDLADFVARGAATFGSGPDPNAETGLKWGERLEDSPELAAAKAKTAAKKGKKKAMSPEMVDKLQSKLQA